MTQILVHVWADMCIDMLTRLRSAPCNSVGDTETQIWKAYYTTTHDEDFEEEDFDLYCLYNSMFTKEEIELQLRQDLLKTIFCVWRQASTKWPPAQETEEDPDIDEFLKIWTGV